MTQMHYEEPREAGELKRHWDGPPRPERIRPGDRVRHYGEQWAAAVHDGTGVAMSIDIDGAVIAINDDGLIMRWSLDKTVLIRPGVTAARTCTFEGSEERGTLRSNGWGPWPGVDGTILICDAHGSPALPSVYENDDHHGRCRFLERFENPAWAP